MTPILSSPKNQNAQRVEFAFQADESTHLKILANTVEHQAVRADIVIPTRNRGARINTAIESIVNSTHDHFKLWIIDQSDDDATERAVTAWQREDERVCYTRSQSRGANFARNEGAALGCAPVILFVDDDCRVEPDWMALMLEELAADEGAWFIFGRVLPDDAYLPEGADEAAPVSEAIPMALKNTPVRRVYAGTRLNLSFGHGANTGCRRKFFERLGGFDGQIGAGGPLGTWDERDIGYRVLSQRDGRIIYTPRPVVYHQHWRDWQAVRSAYRNYAVGTGAAVSKYLRCGDLAGLYLFGEWLLDQGVRQVLSGIFKWQSWQKVQVGLLQIIYPWMGLVRGLRYEINREHVIYGGVRGEALQLEQQG